MRMTAEAEGVLMARPWSGMAQESLSFKDTGDKIIETEEESQEKNLNQRPLGKKSVDKKGCSESLSDVKTSVQDRRISMD